MVRKSILVAAAAAAVGPARGAYVSDMSDYLVFSLSSQAGDANCVTSPNGVYVGACMDVAVTGTSVGYTCDDGTGTSIKVQTYSDSGCATATGSATDTPLACTVTDGVGAAYKCVKGTTFGTAKDITASTYAGSDCSGSATMDTYYAAGVCTASGTNGVKYSCNTENTAIKVETYSGATDCSGSATTSYQEVGCNTAMGTTTNWACVEPTTSTTTTTTTTVADTTTWESTNWVITGSFLGCTETSDLGVAAGCGTLGTQKYECSADGSKIKRSDYTATCGTGTASTNTLTAGTCYNDPSGLWSAKLNCHKVDPSNLSTKNYKQETFTTADCSGTGTQAIIYPKDTCTLMIKARCNSAEDIIQYDTYTAADCSGTVTPGYIKAGACVGGNGAYLKHTCTSEAPNIGSASRNTGIAAGLAAVAAWVFL